METRELVCITCPKGCRICVEIKNDIIKKISGNSCKRGEIYARKELENPSRMVTSVVKVIGGDIEMVSVKTRSNIPKEKIMDCMQALIGVSVQVPIHIGDIIVANIANTGVDMVATKNITASS